MHKYIIYFLLIQLNQFIFAQSAIETVNLNWGTIVEEPALKSRFNISKRYLYLESAFYDDYTTLIPKYVHSFKSIASNSTIKIESFEAIPLTADENFIYKDYSFNTIPELKILKGYENKNQIITVELIPIINDNGVLKKITLIQFNLIPEGIPKSLLKASKTYKASSILSSGDWYKARVSNDGIYKLSYDELLAQGIINPADIRVYGFGGIQQEIFINQEFDDLPEIPIYMDKGIDNVFNSGDYILMYLKGPNNWNYDVVRQEFQHSNNVYSAYSYYYFTTSLGAGNKISDAAIINATETISTLAFNDYVFRDSDEVTLINSGNQMFEKISHKSSVDYSFLISDILKDSTAYFTARTLARSSNTASNFYFMENGQSIMTSSISKLNPGYIYANSNTNSAFFKPFSETNLAINIRFSNNDASATGWIDYFYINFMRNLNLSSSQLFFRYKRGIGTGNICKYTLSNANQNTLIWDISHPHSIKNINYSLSGNNATFKYPADSIKEFVAINKSSTFSKPEFLGKIANQNLHGETQPDYVIVSHERFLSQAEELAEFHRQHSGFKVLVIEATKIYNEFSSGKPEAIAIRNMMKMFYERAGGSGNYPKYLLLFGDGSYDNKNTINPLYQIEP